jgi:hypothetical protein
MSILSNTPKDYYFYTAKTGSFKICRIVLAEKDYWDYQGYKHGTISECGDGINFALMDKMKEATGFNVAEVVEGILEIWTDQSEINVEYLKSKLETLGMTFNPSMNKAWENFEVDRFDEEE